MFKEIKKNDSKKYLLSLSGAPRLERPLDFLWEPDGNLNMWVSAAPPPPLPAGK